MMKGYKKSALVATRNGQRNNRICININDTITYR